MLLHGLEDVMSKRLLILRILAMIEHADGRFDMLAIIQRIGAQSRKTELGVVYSVALLGLHGGLIKRSVLVLRNLGRIENLRCTSIAGITKKFRLDVCGDG